MKSALLVLAVGAGVALLALGAWWTSDATLAEETLSLDPSRANIASASGGGAYRIDLERLAPGDRVLVRVELRDEAVGTASVHERSRVDGLAAPPASEALASASGNVIDLVFEPAAEGEYALVVEGEAAVAPKGKVRVTWDPPVEADRNPVFLGAARAAAVLGGGAALLLFAASWARRRRGLDGGAE